MHVVNTAKSRRATELIKIFGGQVDQFIERGLNYILTDLPKSLWPPQGNDPIIVRAVNNGLKIMSFEQMLSWCQQYTANPSSSDEDDESKYKVNELREPFLKSEDFHRQYAPTVREFSKWPEINVSAPIPLGKSIFNDPSSLSTPNQSMNNNQVNHPNNSAQLTQQANSMRPFTPSKPIGNCILENWARNHYQPATPGTPLTTSNIVNGLRSTMPASMPSPRLVPPKSSQLNQQQQRQQPQTPNNRPQTPITNLQPQTPITNVQPQTPNNLAQTPYRRKHLVYCEICNIKVNTNQLHEHIASQEHKTNTDKLNWKEVHSVISSLTSISALNSKPVPTLTTPTNNEHQEFLCLHKVESVSQIFFTSKEHSVSPIVDRQMVRLELGRVE